MLETGPKCILVVDDEDAIREAVAETLEYEGYRVERASNGQDALAKIGANRPDAIILDLMMPVMDGWTFLQHRMSDPVCSGLPVLVMSAYRMLAETAAELHVQACVAKPFDLDVLLNAVDSVLRTPESARAEVVSSGIADRGSARSGAGLA